MVDRIGTFYQSQTLLNELMRAQRNMLETQQQVATGRKVDELKDAGGQASLLLAARAQQVQSAGYQTTGLEVASRLDVLDANLVGLSDVARDLRQAIMEALANNSGTGFMQRVTGLFENAAQILNTKTNGLYLFGGIRSDVPPVNVSSLAGLRDAPALADVFENALTPLSAAIDEQQTLQYGFLASAVGQELFQLFRDIAQFEQGNGPFGPRLTAAQQAWLSARIQPAVDALENINEAVAQNGMNQRTLETVVARHKDTEISAKRLVSDIEDVDIAEALSRLSRDQLATQAATKVLADLSKISLLDFL